ncbi:FAD-dependent monooxygenase [Nonomuraea sp. NPDC050310]|uniref:FAD-dependent monooxygenase n=1 Tax=Nonomuraea sp. NPDC050310 TaxID=3154935 RepID=UPI0033C8DEFD
MTCVIAGGGPAGAVLALILARAGVEVTLLEKHADFLRDFRGDTIHPSTLQVLEELGLAERFHDLPHRKTRAIRLWTDRGTADLASLRGLPGNYDYIAFVPQWDFLTLVTEAAKECPTFRLIMKAEAHGLIREDGVVRGVRYRTPEGEHEIRADLVVAADGRTSALRAAAGLVPEELGAPMDVVWFRASRLPGDPDETFLRLSAGHFMVAINRDSYWQLAYVIPKGGFDELKAGGIRALHEPLAQRLRRRGGGARALARPRAEAGPRRRVADRLRPAPRRGRRLAGPGRLRTRRRPRLRPGQPGGRAGGGRPADRGPAGCRPVPRQPLRGRPGRPHRGGPARPPAHRGVRRAAGRRRGPADRRRHAGPGHAQAPDERASPRAGRSVAHNVKIPSQNVDNSADRLSGWNTLVSRERTL